MWCSTVGFIVTLTLRLLVAPLIAEAQPAGKVHRIGELRGAAPIQSHPVSEAFRQGLRDLGYVEGQNLVIEYRSAEGRVDRLPSLAAELVRLPVEVLVVGGTPAVHAAQQATRTIPIVMVAGSDPVAAGWVASLGHPGGNITGLTNLGEELLGKQLEVLKEMVPQSARIAVLANPADPNYAQRMNNLREAAQALSLQLHVVEVRRADEVDTAFAAMSQARADALLLVEDGLLLTTSLRGRLADLAATSLLPSMYSQKAFVEAGGLMSYGASLVALSRRTAYYVDRILKGAKPADLPVERPTKFELVINLKTAKALGMTMPPSLLLLADEVIQ